MKVYLVGGYVRDKLLGLESKDRDYVVVGSTPGEMLSLGYKQVGSDFPVFLHPETGEEYALARTEVKNGIGYQGFDCHFDEHVTLEEDLKRRDLTINAMAEDLETGEIIDPFKGQEAIRSKMLDATSKAFEDDPVRVLRVARFASTLPGHNWQVGCDTYLMCQRLWKKEQRNVTAERVFKELQKALSGDKPHKFFELMELFGDVTWFKEYFAGKDIPQPPAFHPEGNCLIHQQLCIKQGVKLGCSPKELFAIMCHDFGKAPCHNERGNLHGHEKEGVKYVEEFCDRLKVPSSWRELAIKVCRWHTHAHRAFDMKPNKIMKLFEAFGTKDINDYFKLLSFLKCCEADAKGRGPTLENKEYPQARYLIYCWLNVFRVDTKEISSKMLSEGKEGVLIGEAIRVAKIDAIREVKKRWEKKEYEI